MLPHPSGLSRNVVHCLHDFDIPLHLATTVVEIHGRDRVDQVTVAPVDDGGVPRIEKAWDVPCDTLLISIGLIPENELAHQLRVRLDPATSGPVVTSTMETSRNGVFACGNVVHIHDLVDFVSAEAELAGACAGRYALGRSPARDNVRLQPGTNVGYCVPHTITTDRDHTVYLRVRQALERSALRLTTPDGQILHERKLRYVVPAEMATLKLRRGVLNTVADTVIVEVVPR